MPPSDTYDLRTATFEELIDFYFNNKNRVGWSDDWYVSAEILYDPTHQASFFIELFQKSALLRTTFDKSQINEGIWLLSSTAFAGNVYDIVLQDEDAPFELRQQCIRTMYDLFENVFAVEPMEAGSFWWDNFAGHRNGFAWEPSEPTQLADTIFETLLHILQLDSDFCRSCALDGISQLRHRNTAESLTAFLQHTRVDARNRSTILHVIESNPPFPLS